MKSKSFINFKIGAETLFNIAAAGRLKYGLILAESYWKRLKNGNITQSAPDTDEILTALFYPIRPAVFADGVKIENVPTGVKIEALTDAAGVNIERIVYKPPLNIPPPTVEEMRAAMLENFKKHFAAND